MDSMPDAADPPDDALQGDPTVDLSIVIPAYNEAERLPRTVADVRDHLAADGASWEIIVVSDGSTDGTAAALAPLAAADPRIRLIDERPNRGKGFAVRRGILAARGRRILFSDADLSTPVAERHALAAALDAGADVAVASRRAPGADVRVPQPFLRRLSGRLFYNLVRLLTGVALLDTQCGFKMFSREAARTIFPRCRENGFSFDVEILCLARETGLRVAEVPVVWRDAPNTRVRLPRDAFRMLRGLLALAAPGRSPSVLKRQTVGVCAGGVALLALLWFLILGAAPLYDTTEGRYGAVAAQMHRLDDWVTPWTWKGEYPVPFWGKPPLHFWLMRLSFAAFGENEWAARLPGFLCGLGLLGWTALLGRAAGGGAIGALAAFLAASTCLFFIAWGLVLTDVTASLCVTGALGSFFLAEIAAAPARRAWSYAFFAWLGLGMLAKGPVVVVLTLLPLLLWALHVRGWRRLARLPWAGGLLLATALAAPWYALAERTTPGFLRYFLVNEHILRFLHTDAGDLYGHAHVEPRGAIWGMYALGLLPWTVLLLPERRSFPPRPDRREADAFFLWWAAAPAIFFTLSRSVLPTYLLPTVGGAALLLARRVTASPSFATRRLLAGAAFCCLVPWGLAAFAVWKGTGGAVGASAAGGVLAGIWTAAAILRTPPAALAAAALGLAGSTWAAREAVLPLLDAERSTRGIVRAAFAAARDPADRIVVGYANDPSFVFYGRGRLTIMPGLHERHWKALLTDEVTDFFIIPERACACVPPLASDRIALVALDGRFRLYRERPPAARE